MLTAILLNAPSKRIFGFYKLRTIPKSLVVALLTTLLLFTVVTPVHAQCSLTLTPANINHPSCGGNDGSFQVQVEGIDAPYQYWLYKIVNGSPVLQENGTLIAGTPTFVLLTAGEYRLDVSKDGTCNGSVSVTLTQSALTLTPTNIREATCGGNEGSFQVQVEGIEAPYQYKLNKIIDGSPVLQENGTLIAGTPTFVFLKGGTYTLSVSKSGTCSGEVTVEVPQQELTLTPTNIKEATCGAKDGSFQVQVDGMVAPYQYKLNKIVDGSPVLQENGTLIAGTPTFVFLEGGTYTLSVTKGGTCSGEVTVEVPQKELVLTPANIKAASCGGNDGSFNVQVEGMTAPYQYKLSKMVDGSPVVQESGTLIAGTPTFVFLTAGEYLAEFSKGGTCSGSVSVTIEQTPLTASLGDVTLPSCTGNDGGFNLQVAGMVPPYQYTLYRTVNGNPVQIAAGTVAAGMPTFNGLPVGAYSVTITKGSCTATIPVYLNCEVLGREGCSPGYWKNHPETWTITNYAPSQTVEAVFDVPDALVLDNTTLITALDGAGGKSVKDAAKILLRAAVAGILNAVHPDVDYSIKLNQLLSQVNAALASGDRKTILALATKLDGYNNLVCPSDKRTIPLMPSVQSNGAAAVVDLEMPLNLRAIPNPSNGVFNVQIESRSTEKVNVYIMDILGRVIERWQQVAPNQTIRIGEAYKPGFYILEVQQGAARKQLKLVKSNK